MDDLIIRVVKHEATAAEQDRLREWRREIAANEERFQQVVLIWALTEIAHPMHIAPPVPDPDILIHIADSQSSVRQRSDSRDAVTVKPLPRAPRWKQLRRYGIPALAASIVLAAIGLYTVFTQKAVNDVAILLPQVTTGNGELATLTLKNGTSVRLGPRSKIRITEQDGATIAHLDGRAFFGVNASRFRPFIVRTKYGDATVHGTRFEVRSEAEELRVLVVEGKVRVSAEGDSSDLTAGFMSVRRSGTPTRTYQVDGIESQLVWMGNTLIFQETPLVQAIAEIESRYHVDIVLETRSRGDLTVTAAFTDQKLEDVVQVVCAAVRAECSINRD